MPEAKYRTIVHYDPEKRLFVARTPELEHCQAEGASRAEALGKLEEEMDAQIRNMMEQGGQPPAAVDQEEFSGEVQARVSRTLHRELAYQARSEGVELQQLVGELLASGLEGRRGQRSGGRRPGGNSELDGDRNNRNHERGRMGQGGFGTRYHGIMDDRANFIEYVRTLEQNGGPAGGGGSGLGGGAGRRRRRGRGKGGPGGGGGM
jgi:predicted HicB family RNase H-like nuclease